MNQVERFNLEDLEPRILLSGNGAVPVGDASSSGQMAVVVVQSQEELAMGNSYGDDLVYKSDSGIGSMFEGFDGRCINAFWHGLIESILNEKKHFVESNASDDDSSALELKYAFI